MDHKLGIVIVPKDSKDQPPLERLKCEWQDAKKAADSLSADFRDIEGARERTGDARKLYLDALRRAKA